MSGKASTRRAALLRCGWGAACLLVPRQVVAAARGLPDRPAQRFTRLLGGREVVQGLASLALPDRHLLVLGAAVDALHATSVLALAAVDRRRRRPALVNAAVSAGWGGLWLALARQS